MSARTLTDAHLADEHVEEPHPSCVHCSHARLIVSTNGKDGSKMDNGKSSKHTPGPRPWEIGTPARLAVYESGALEDVTALKDALDSFREMDTPADVAALLARVEALSLTAHESIRRARTLLSRRFAGGNP